MIKKKSHKKDYLRWILVFPTAISVWFGIQLLIAFLILAPFYSTLMESLYGRWIGLLKEYVFYAVAPYWAVKMGSKIAPNNVFRVSIVLATLIIVLQFINLYYLIIADSGITLLLIIGTFVTIISVSFAVYQTKKENN